MRQEFNTYRSDLEQTVRDVRDLKTTTDRIALLVGAGKFAVGRFKTADKTVEKTVSALDVTKAGLFVAGFLTPIKTPVKALETVIKRVERPVDKIDEQIDKVSGKDDPKTPQKEGDNAFVNKIESALGTTQLALAPVQDSLTLKLRQLETASKAFANFDTALDTALARGAPWGGTYDSLNAAIEAQLGARNDLQAGLAAFFERVKADVGEFLDTLVAIDFNKILGELVDLDEIGKVFDFLEKPLAIAESLIEPIKPLLNAIDALVGLIVNPIIDYVVETLQLGKVIDDAVSTITDLLPSLNLLEAFNNLMAPLHEFLLDYIERALGTTDLLDAVEERFFGDVVGNADAGPTGWGTALDDLLEGDGGDDILDGLDGRDTIRGGAGEDIIIAGLGSDLLDGGSGRDLFHFDASFTQYELSAGEGSGDIIANHLLPSDPGKNTGVDIMTNMDDGDRVVFTDISFTGKELKEALYGGSILNGDSGDNLMFLNRSGTKIDDLHVANGRDGDDRIFGTIENDRLNGGRGNDILLPGVGDDEANGQGGRDTFQVLAGQNSEMTVDLIDGTAFGQGQDRLNSIENVIVSAGQNHEVRANDRKNVIFTGDGIDVVSGLAGADVIDSGGDEDYIIGGAGSDVIYAGAGNIDVMMSGSAAANGVRDTYFGGDGFDVVSYTSSANAILFDINNQTDDPRIGQTFKRYLSEAEDSGRVVIRSGKGEIARFDDIGRRVSTDKAVDVEGFMGSDRNDLLIGSPGTVLLHGGGGRDTIRSNGTETLMGGDGDDLIIAQDVRNGSTALQVVGGAGFDRLKLDGVGDARWFYRVESSISLTLRAHKTSVEGEDLRNERDVFFSLKPREIEEITLGDFDDHAIYAPGGSGNRQAFFLRDGNDRFDGENGFGDVSAGRGNDIGNFDRGGGGIFRGQGGDDYAVFNDTGTDNAALMGSGSDFVQIERFNGRANGGSGYDTISFDVNFASRIVADLDAGRVASFKGVNVNNADQVNMTLRNFEQLIATEYRDTVDGSGADEQILGRGGSDTVRGEGGRDKLFGGDGDDLLEGGLGADLLHGGAGNDDLRGGAGDDTVSYSWVRSGGIEGELFADTFGDVTVDLRSRIASGDFGTDRLASIENALGGGGADVLLGNARDNLLSGGDGDDELFGRRGKDVLVTGDGTDTVSGGPGRDTVVVGIGDKDLRGGSGFDTLDFGTVGGAVTLDLRNGTYSARLVEKVPRWSDRDLDNDGRNDSDGTETRSFGGVAMSPLDVFEAKPSRANSVDDLSRIIPDVEDDEFGDFLIEIVDVRTSSNGAFAGIETFKGGEAGTALKLSKGVDRFDGSVSNRDVIDLSNTRASIEYDFRTGENNVRLLDGDSVTGIDGLLLGRGNDRVWGDGSGNPISGGAGRDIIKGFGGADDLRGQDGRDVVRGAAGRDDLRGNRGEDRVYGDGGNDRLWGGLHEDRLYGGGGRDRLWGEDGADKMFGGRGSDDLRGQDGRDLMRGGGGRDDLVGNRGNDRLYGDAGRDELRGNLDNDRLYGGGGGDRIWGGENNDRLFGGRGNDVLTGDPGADIFVFRRGDGRDTITDFAVNVDTMRIVSGASRFRDLDLDRDGKDTIVSFANVEIRVEGVRPGQLDADDFSF